MQIILSGALPDAELAVELAQHLAERAPTLAHWLERGSATMTPSRAADTWCTPLEHWQLIARGFTPVANQHISAGLGPLCAAVDDDDPIWLADLIHMAPSRDGAALLPAEKLDITEEETRALLHAAQPDLADNGIDLQLHGAHTCRVRWPQAVDFACASPALVARSSVNDWWPQSDQARPWRRLVNSLQMAWYEHPVNVDRAQAGKPPLNSLWLYGGARRNQLALPPPQETRTEGALQDFAVRQDWGGWLEALTHLEAQVFAPLRTQSPTLVLTGRERFATVVPQHGLFARLRRQDWRRWWCNRAS